MILSNVDNENFSFSNRKLGVDFDAIYTAEDIGSYKPSLRNFEYMLAQLAERGIAKDAILHTAESMFHDHKPANAVGLKSAGSTAATPTRDSAPRCIRATCRPTTSASPAWASSPRRIRRNRRGKGEAMPTFVLRNANLLDLEQGTLRRAHRVVA